MSDATSINVWPIWCLVALADKGGPNILRPYSAALGRSAVPQTRKSAVHYRMRKKFPRSPATDDQAHMSERRVNLGGAASPPMEIA